MNRTTLLSLALGSASLVLAESTRGIADLSTAFETWEAQYAKTYKTPEFRDRAFMTWVANLGIVEAVNANPTSSWRAGMNSFADLSQEDFARTVLMDPRSKPPERPPSQETWVAPPAPRTLPDAFDWRARGAVTPVHDQGSVGTCWAFSSIGNVEGQWFLHSDELTDLSEEFLVDCDGTHDNTHADCGVFGGWPYLAYQYMVEAGGVPTEQVWPYCSGTGDCYPCLQGPISLCGPPPYYCEPEIEERCPTAPKYAKISGWMDISTDEAVIADALYNIGPLSALLDATQLQFYDSGIWTGHVSGSPVAAACKEGHYDHAILIVGYGTEDGQDYWTVKNSWGERWGEDGYFRILRGSSTCGINGEVTTAIV